MRRRLVSILALLVVAAAVAGHVVAHYAPRERAGAPDRGAAAALFRQAPLPYRVWIPYPHQNLARLRRDVPSGASGLLRLFGLKIPRLPRFGPFDVPPSSAIAVASDARGERIMVAAEVYPAIAFLARAAGKLAGNPWLSGGQVESGHRGLRVGWSAGRIWWVTSGGAEEMQRLTTRDVNGDDPLPPALAWLRTEKELGPLPAGDYRLEGPTRQPRLIFRAGDGQETTVVDLQGDVSRLELRLPPRAPAD